jgi:pilus assembly protein CpaB
MNQSRLLAAFALALVLGLVASFLVYRKLQEGTMKAVASTHQVVTASRDLEIGSKLESQDVKVLEWSAGNPPAGNFSKSEDVVGRAVLYPLVAGEPILEAKLAPVGAGAGLPATIPDGMRAVSIRVDEVVAVAGFVGPGARVDVLLTGNPGDGRSGGEALTRTILENVQVLAAGQKVQPDAQGRPEKVNVVTLLCNPSDAAKVTLAANEGKIQLVLRNPTDSEKAAKDTMVARRALYGGALKEQPAPKVRVIVKKEPVAPPPPPVEPPPPTTGTIQMIRGERAASVEVPLSKAQ